jgi:hypothetical protein
MHFLICRHDIFNMATREVGICRQNSINIENHAHNVIIRIGFQSDGFEAAVESFSTT